LSTQLRRGPSQAIMWKLLAEIRAPARVVATKALYLLAVMGCWGVCMTIVQRVVWTVIQPRGDHESAMSYAMASTVAQGFVGLFFLVWLRHVYRSDGGKLAGLILVGFGLVSAVALMLIAQFLT